MAHKHKKTRISFDYIHAVIDDHSRLAYAEIQPDEKGVTAAGVLERAAVFFAENGIPKIERVLSDNAFAYRKSTAFKDAVTKLGRCRASSRRTTPGPTERLNDSTAPSPPNGPTNANTPATNNALKPLHPG